MRDSSRDMSPMRRYTMPQGEESGQQHGRSQLEERGRREAAVSEAAMSAAQSAPPKDPRGQGTTMPEKRAPRLGAGPAQVHER